MQSTPVHSRMCNLFRKLQVVMIKASSSSCLFFPAALSLTIFVTCHFQHLVCCEALTGEKEVFCLLRRRQNECAAARCGWWKAWYLQMLRDVHVVMLWTQVCCVFAAQSTCRHKYIPILSPRHICKAVEVHWDQLTHFSGAFCRAAWRHMFTVALSNNYILQSSAERAFT